MKIEIYVDNDLYAGRKMAFVPRVGDLIQLGLDLYKVEMVVWCDPDNGDQVNLFTSRHEV